MTTTTPKNKKRKPAVKRARATSAPSVDERTRDSQRKNLQRARKRDIGPLPAVADPERRERCRRSSELFNRTYFPHRFGWPFADCHREAMGRMERSTHEGGQFACAMPRSTGKTTLAECEVIRAIVYGYRRFYVLLQATEPLGGRSLRKIQRELETNDLLLADFPEVCYPIRCLERIANRAAGQTLDGIPTRMEWSKNLVTFPTVRDSAASGSVIWVGGLTGAVRGLSASGPNGEIIRPDAILIDDAQTRESAKSLAQTDEREQIIEGDVMGLAGPGTQIAATMLCTVIYPGDLSSRYLDAEKKPEWQAIKTRMVESLPINLTLWDQYDDVRRAGHRARDGGHAANEFYAANRAALDEGARVSWPERVKSGEVSAIQGAMNLYYRNRRVFDAEYQNDPQPELEAGQLPDLDADTIAARVNHSPRLTVPSECSRLTAFIDCGNELLWYVVCGWSEKFGGAVVDYGTFPRQNRTYFAKNDARPALSDAFPGLGDESRLWKGLQALTGDLLGRTFSRADGGSMTIGKCLIDAGYLFGTVVDCIRKMPPTWRSLVCPSKGYGVTAGRAPMDVWGKKDPGERKGDNWRQRPDRLVIYDTNHWKTFVAARLSAPPGDSGALYLFGDGKGEHQLFADHCAAETRTQTQGHGRKLHEWSLKPGRDNDWWDCLVGCAVAASVQGLAWDSGVAAGEAPRPRPARKITTLSELYDQKHGRGRR